MIVFKTILQDGIELNDNIFMLDSLPLLKEIDRVNGVKNKQSYKLSDIYERLIGKKADNAHSAESDCLTLLKIAITVNYQFVTTADILAKSFNQNINIGTCPNV